MFKYSRLIPEEKRLIFQRTNLKLLDFSLQRALLFLQPSNEAEFISYLELNQI